MADIPVVHFKVTGRQPDDSEVRELSSMPMAKRRPSSEEVKDSLKWFFFGIIAGPLAILLGVSILKAKNLAGIGKLVIGFGAPFAGVVLILFAFYSLSKMFRSAQKKTPGKAAKWFWLTSVMGQDVATDTRFGKLEYTLATMARMLPADVEFSEEKETLWLIDFQQALEDAANSVEKKLRSAGNLTLTAPQLTFLLKRENTVSPGLVQVSALMTFYDMFSIPNNNQNTKIPGAKLELDISQYYVQNGKVWFPYDLTPSYERTDSLPEEEPETAPEEQPKE